MKKVIAVVSIMALIAIMGIGDAYPGSLYSGSYYRAYWDSPYNHGYTAYNPTSGWMTEMTNAYSPYRMTYYGYVSPWGW